MTYLRTISFISLTQASSFVHALESVTGKIAEPKSIAVGGLSDPNMASSLIQTTLGLLVVLAVIGGAAWAFKRFGNFQTGVQGKLKIVGGISLGTRERVVLLQVGEQQLVVGVAPGQIQTLHVLDEPLPTDAAEEAPSFSMRLQSAMAKHVAKKSAGKDASANNPDGEV